MRLAYVFNPMRNPRMGSPGIHFTLDDELKWQAAAADGLKGQINALAVHPNDAKTVAAATRTACTTPASMRWRSP